MGKVWTRESNIGNRGKSQLKGIVVMVVKAVQIVAARVGIVGKNKQVLLLEIIVLGKAF